MPGKIIVDITEKETGLSFHVEAQSSDDTSQREVDAGTDLAMKIQMHILDFDRSDKINEKVSQ
ncbi:hypothetical protein ACTVPQ_05770 [Serratia bockelmannii]|uniref:hypothetical protein n=1 Tax=Serratia bockelmannii TaxID=2703793 RepID=UPI003FA78993